MRRRLTFLKSFQGIHAQFLYSVPGSPEPRRFLSGKSMKIRQFMVLPQPFVHSVILRNEVTKNLVKILTDNSNLAPLRGIGCI